MSTKKEPTWEVYSGRPAGNAFSFEKRWLVAYAKHAKKDGWFVRVSGVNNNNDPETEKMYIGDDVFPPDFMIAMLGMNKNVNT